MVEEECSLQVINELGSLTSCSNWQMFYNLHQNLYEENAKLIKSKPILNVTKSRGSLYVQQGEYAILSNTDPIFEEIGSDRSTTCHIVILQTKNKSLTALGHFDGSSTKQGLKSMVKDIIDRQSHFVNELDLHIVGGFMDKGELSSKLTAEIINAFCDFDSKENPNKQELQFRLKTFCCTELNTVFKFSSDLNSQLAFPAILGVVINTSTGEINPAVFDNDAMGPAGPLRGARIYSDEQTMTNIYKPEANLLQINKFKYNSMQDALMWSQQPNEIIRRYMSTSPDAEPANFEFHTRNTLRFLHNHPNSEEVFNGHPYIYFKPQKIESEITWTKL